MCRVPCLLEHLCPSCHQTAETVDHFLACAHSTCQQVWKELHEVLHKHQIHHTVSNVFFNMFVYGLYHGQQAPTNSYLQSSPSWPPNSVLCSRTSRMETATLWMTHTFWITLLDFYQPLVNGLQYFTKVVTVTWQAILQIWTLQNVNLPPDNPEQEECSQLKAAVNQIFFEAQQDPLLHVLVENLL